MKRREFVAQVLRTTSGSAIALSMSGCATILHSERIHQPHSRDLDWKMVALDGLGLIFFFIPGVIAFAVDFYTGAIYMPPYPIVVSEYPQTIALEPAKSDAVVLRKVPIQGDVWNIQSVEQELATELGHPVEVCDKSARLDSLQGIDQFSQLQQRHIADSSLGLSPRAFLRRWSLFPS